MAYIITSKTRSKARRQQSRGVHQSSYGRTTYSPEAKEQYGRVSKENKQEFRDEKRMLELSKKGFNEAAIAGMMYGDKNTTSNEAKVKKAVKKYKGIIKTDGNI